MTVDDHHANDVQSLPSPSTSPALTPRDPGSPKSRKRQRSQSMETDVDPSSSSSLKRPVAESDSHCPAPQPSNISSLSLDTLDDANVPVQDDGISSDAISTHSHVISGKQKLAIIDDAVKSPMQVGETWYLVARDWYRKWRKACSGAVDKEGLLLEEDLGPVDNSSLVDKKGHLISSCVEGVDVEFVPTSIWSLFISWYGDSQYPLPRKVISRGIMQETVLELHPSLLKVLRLDPLVDSVSGPALPYVQVSSSVTVKEALAALAEAVRPDVPSETPYRVWKLKESLEVEGSLYPCTSLLGSADLVQASGIPFFVLHQTGDEFVVEFKQDGEWIFVDSGSPARDETPPPTFAKGDFFTQLSKSHARTKSTGINGTLPKMTGSTFSITKPAPSTAFGHAVMHSRPSPAPGTIGLGNMGNTCFMNSALQCLAHTQELSDYFLLGVYKEELNPDNPLGMRGAIAEAFGALLHRIWDPDSPSFSYSPREFKLQLQRFAPQFSGYQQHDSQELVAFLLDGLHEDLNRVLKKPYVEKPDWDGGGDTSLVELARSSWEGYMKRNDSVIVDLFQGQYQSTLVCPECQKVSITFDPFMYLTLPLPVQRKWKHAIFYVPWDVEKPHLKVHIEISRDASFKAVRNLLGRWMGAQPDNLLTVEIFNHRFYKNLDDTVICGDMSDNDIIFCFELPCNSQQSRTKKQPDDPFILPLFLYEAAPTNRFIYGRANSLFGYPSVVVISQQQATDMVAIYEAIVERLQRWTMNARELYTWDLDSPSASESMDEVPIHITSRPPVDSLTEIKENGDVVTVEAPPPEEGDIVDEKSVVEEAGDLVDGVTDGDGMHPRKVRAKTEIFNLRLRTGQKDFGTGVGYGPDNARFVRWDERMSQEDLNPVLLREGDAFVCEFDENMKTFFFGDGRPRWEHARWEVWEEFTHPEYTEAQLASASQKAKGISLQDCLEEFTNEEQLGEDDLWYCPRCKKHQQATKKFDLWKSPDVLVVHLKRFSNNRMLRDKIDAFVDFPIQDLDLTDKVGERKMAKKLLAEGVDIESLGLSNPDERLVYDLYAVAEHMGGLGGGHYRAYAMNHLNGRWYHFDDSFVNEARPTDAVNANAYLLFYRRRTERPLGGKTHSKVESARLNPQPSSASEPVIIETQIPTPPNEPTSSFSHAEISHTSTFPNGSHFPSSQLPAFEEWSSRFISLPSSSAPPALDDAFERRQFDMPFPSYDDDPLQTASQQFDFPDPTSKWSPTSSVEAQPDLTESLDHTWRSIVGSDSPNSPREYSPASSVSDHNPFSDANAQKSGQIDDETDRTDVPTKLTAPT